MNYKQTAALAMVTIMTGMLPFWGCAKKNVEIQPGALAGLSNPSIHILVDQENEIPATGSFGWGYCLFRVPSRPDLQLDIINERLHHALQTQLTHKGYTFVAADPKILVSYALADAAEIDNDELNQIYGDRLQAPVSKGDASFHYKRGVLVVDFVERQTKHLLWRGAIMAEIDPAWPEERKQERCNAAIGALLLRFPKP